MKRRSSMGSVQTVLAIGLALAAFAPIARAEQEKYQLPTYNAALEKAVEAENLKAVASKSSDPDVLLGLDFLVRRGNAARREIAELVVKAKPAYAPIVAVVAVQMDGPDEKTIAELIKSDPDNACGYYLQGHLLCEADKEKEALAAYRKGAACPELRLYESVTGPAVFKALDALDLKGRDRVCALSWAAMRGGTSWQDVVNALAQMAQNADLETRKEISEILLLLAGQLYTTNFENRWYVMAALQNSFRYKAEAAASEKSPAMNSYVAVTQALVSVQGTFGDPGFLGVKTLSHDLIANVPWSIHNACGMSDPACRKEFFASRGVNVPERDQAALDKAREAAVSASTALIDAALAAPDEIVGAYLLGLPPPRKNGSFPWVSWLTYPERVMLNRPDFLKAVVAFHEAFDAMNQAAKNDLRRRNVDRMMDIDKGIIGYADEHNATYPDSLNVLFEKKYVELPVEAKSLLTGRPYVYVAAGQKWPEKTTAAGKFILLYDDQISDGRCYCIMADGHGSLLPVDKVRAQLQKQGKQGP